MQLSSTVSDLLKSVSARTRTLVILIILAGLAFIVLSSSNEAAFVLVIDSGSTGTRIVAYRWQEKSGRPPQLTALAREAAQHKVPRKAAGDIRAYERVETEPGLDKFVDDPTGLWTSALQPLLAWAEAVVPKSRWSATPVFLFGTAGLRVLTPDSQDGLLGHVRRILRACPFRFESDWARVISGKDEGVYGWIALNYLTGHLAANTGLEGRHGVRGETVGAVDLGGSSLEVSFVPDEPFSSESQVNITILGTNYSLYSHVHHSYGLNDAFDRSVAHLLTAQQLSVSASALQDSVHQKPLDQDDTAVATEAATEATIEGATEAAEGRRLAAVDSPPADEAAATEAAEGRSQDKASAKVTQHDKANASFSQLLSSNRRRRTGITRQSSSSHPSPGASKRHLLQEGLQVTHPCLHEGYSKDYAWVAHGAHVTPLPKVQLLGRPDWEECKALAAAVVNASQPCLSGDSCALGITQPATSQQMFALTGFFVVLKFLNLPSHASLAALEAAGQGFCSTPWPTVNLTRGAEMHVDRYCFRVPYIIHLLTEGLGLPEAQVTVGSGKEAWTLGAALAEGSKALHTRSLTSTPIPGGSYMHHPAVWVLAGIFVAVSLALLLYLFCFQVVQKVVWPVTETSATTAAHGTAPQKLHRLRTDFQ
ncbi:hypothetical protein ABBQ38_005618 [Trebouxia sp. C0009 RCD-2024]